MDFRIFIEPQTGATYDQQVAVAQHAEREGFSGFFRSDHIMAVHGAGLPGPTESWVTLAGIARETSTIRLGTLVTNSNLRHPAMLAISVAQVDAMSGGRVELGLGAGWFDREHSAYGMRFPAGPERVDRLEEQLAFLTGWWRTDAGSPLNFNGHYYQAIDAPALPKPVQEHVPLIVGGLGKRRTPQIAARHADEFNTNFTSLEDTEAAYARVRMACEEIDRDPASLTWSISETIVTGRNQAEVDARGFSQGPGHQAFVARELYGVPSRVLDLIGAYRDLGVQRIYLQLMDIDDLDYISFVADEIVAKVD